MDSTNLSGKFDGNVTYYMYLLFEEYISEQEAFNRAIVRNLQLLGFLKEKVMVEPNFYGIGLRPFNTTIRREIIVSNLL